MAAGKEAGNGMHPATTETPQAPRRLVLLDGEPHGEAEQVLVEYPPSAAIGRPVQGDAAPGIAGGDRLEDAAFGIEREGFRDLAPQPAEAGGRAGADQTGEFVRAERKTALGIHLPQEAQRVTAALGRGLVEP